MHKYKNYFDNIKTPYFALLIVKTKEELTFNSTIEEMSYDNVVLKMVGVSKLRILKHHIEVYGLWNTLILNIKTGLRIK